MNLQVLNKISYGMYVVCSKKGDKINGQIVNTVFQITSEPPTIAVSINKKNLTYEYIKESKVFTLSILSKDTPLKFIGQFGFKSGREINKFVDLDYNIGRLKCPIVLTNAIGYIEAEVINEVDAGTHIVFIGKIIEADILKEAEAMTYSYYHEIKHGTTPENAPTYMKEKIKEVPKMDKYRCTVCGYIYEPENGDPDANIQPGTSFEQLPDNWVCPVCGVGKDKFEKVI
ncbi:MAG: rubredoxin [Candidatus Firestonebacteria bacterium]